MIGQTISRYRLEEKLGEGGMGIVYRACDLRLGRMVAFKTLRSEFASDSSLRRRLATEAQAASALNHPVIATLFDFEADGDIAFLVYEYVKGTTLRDLDSVRPLTLEQVIAIFITIADGLAAAHQAGIIHRDLKPENIMIGDDGRVKILDFGLAKVNMAREPGSMISTFATTPGFLLGTVAYMSPEQLEGEPVDQRADIFAFGTMLYELAVKRHPFAGKSPSSTIGNILKGEPPGLSTQLKSAPIELERVIRKCLRKERAERYQSFFEVGVDLKGVLRDLSGSRPQHREALPGPEPVFALSRAAARSWFLVLQCFYLVVYGVAICYTGRIAEILERVFGLPATASFGITISAMCGVALRLYFLTGVGLNHPQAPALFRQAFPLLLLLDTLWATSPLLLWDKILWGTLVCVVAMAPLPFTQRTLMLHAYPVKEGL